MDKHTRPETAGHTQGPWEVREVGFTFHRYVIWGDTVKVCDLAQNKDTQANARLIVAAPDLLAACESVMATFAKFREEQPVIPESECITLCRAALAKARA